MLHLNRLDYANIKLCFLYGTAIPILRHRIASPSSNTTLLAAVQPLPDCALLARRTFASNKSPIDEFRQQEEQRNDQDDQAENAPTSEEAKRAKVDAVRETILNASLPFVLKQGWTREALQLGAASMNYPGVVHGLFPGGGIELIQHFVLSCDRRLVEELLKKPKTTKEEIASLPPEFVYVARAIRKRLQMLDAVRERWPQAMAMRALPAHAVGAFNQTLKLVDDICYLAGDRSADVSSAVECHTVIFL